MGLPPLVLKYLNRAIELEVANSDILKSNLRAARRELNSKLKDNPDLFLGKELGLEIDAILESTVLNPDRQLPVESTYTEGSIQGYQLVASSSKIPASSVYFSYTPSLNLRALSLAESTYADIIKAASGELKTDILRSVQRSIAQGKGTKETADAILGTGLRGLNGRDGVFRSATTRAEVIARTVTNDLLNRAAVDTYSTIQEDFPDLNIRKQWITTSDTRTSDRCISLANQVRDIKEDFESSDGWTGLNPPSHPNCRSRVISLSTEYSPELEGKLIDSIVTGVPKSTSKSATDLTLKGTKSKVIGFTKSALDELSNEVKKQKPKTLSKLDKIRAEVAKGDKLAKTRANRPDSSSRQSTPIRPLTVTDLASKFKPREPRNFEAIGATRFKELEDVIDRRTKELEKSSEIKALRKKQQKAIKDTKSKDPDIRASGFKEANIFETQIARAKAKDPEIRKSLSDIRTRLRSRVDKEAATKAAKRVKLGHNLPHLTAEEYREEMEMFHTLTGNKVRDVKLLVNQGGPAHADYRRRTINVSDGWNSDRQRISLWHEMGHYLEYEHPEIKQASFAFLEINSTGPQRSMLENIPNAPKGFFTEADKGYPGNFVHPYVGRTYGKFATEVTAVGMEHMVDTGGMYLLRTKDRRHYNHMIGILSEDL